MTSPYGSFGGVRPHKIWAGAVARAVQGDRITMAVIDLDPDITVPEHSHENEQLGFVIQGSVTMTVAGESRELRAGETYAIPANVRHSAATGPEGATVVDVFSPPRADWEGLERLEPSAGRWP